MKGYENRTKWTAPRFVFFFQENQMAVQKKQNNRNYSVALVCWDGVHVIVDHQDSRLHIFINYPCLLIEAEIRFGLHCTSQGVFPFLCCFAPPYGLQSDTKKDQVCIALFVVLSWFGRYLSKLITGRNNHDSIRDISMKQFSFSY